MCIRDSSRRLRTNAPSLLACVEERGARLPWPWRGVLERPTAGVRPARSGRPLRQNSTTPPHSRPTLSTGRSRWWACSWARAAELALSPSQPRSPRTTSSLSISPVMDNRTYSGESPMVGATAALSGRGHRAPPPILPPRLGPPANRKGQSGGLGGRGGSPPLERPPAPEAPDRWARGAVVHPERLQDLFSHYSNDALLHKSGCSS
eukprot:15466969-Alexandrium_andersonii.AAC.1